MSSPLRDVRGCRSTQRGRLTTPSLPASHKVAGRWGKAGRHSTQAWSGPCGTRVASYLVSSIEWNSMHNCSRHFSQIIPASLRRFLPRACVRVCETAAKLGRWIHNAVWVTRAARWVHCIWEIFPEHLYLLALLLRNTKSCPFFAVSLWNTKKINVPDGRETKQNLYIL